MPGGNIIPAPNPMLQLPPSGIKEPYSRCCFKALRVSVKTRVHLCYGYVLLTHHCSSWPHLLSSLRWQGHASACSLACASLPPHVPPGTNVVIQHADTMQLGLCPL
jgi:hypothetical protein